MLFLTHLTRTAEGRYGAEDYKEPVTRTSPRSGEMLRLLVLRLGLRSPGGSKFNVQKVGGHQPYCWPVPRCDMTRVKH